VRQENKQQRARGACPHCDRPSVPGQITCGRRDCQIAHDPANPATRARRGRPFASSTKEAVSIRLDRRAIEAFRATGEGWQTRINAVVARAAKRIK